MHSFHQILTFVILQILLWCNDGAEATAIKKRMKPDNLRVGVELDVDLWYADNSKEEYLKDAPLLNVKPANRAIFMAHWRVPAPLTDGQLVQVAMDGYIDLLKGVQPATYGSQVGFSRKALPTVMTVFRWDNELIITSSQSRGIPLTYTRNKHILALFQRCIHPNPAKSAQAKCGEMSAAQLFAHL